MRTFTWVLLGFVTPFESGFMQEFVDFMDGRIVAASLWVLGTLFIATATVAAEQLRLFLEE